MADNMIQIDLGKMNAEIDQLQARIETLNVELNKKTEARNFIHSLAGIGKTRGRNAGEEGEGKASKAAGKGASKGSKGAKRTRRKSDPGLSDFVLSHLGNGSSNTQGIIDAYAQHSGQSAADARSLVTSTLNKLKGGKKVAGVTGEGGRRAGTTWSLTS